MVEIIIKELNKSRDDYGDEIMRLQNKLSLAEAYVGAIDTRLRHAEKKAYEDGFNDYITLVVKILPEIKAQLLQIPFIDCALASLHVSQASQGLGWGSWCLCIGCNLYFFFIFSL